MARSHDETSESFAEAAVPTRKHRWWWVALALPMVSLIFTFGMPLINGLFPQKVIEGCTIEKKSSYRSRSIPPTRPSDCGTFRSSKEVACTTDPAKQLSLVPGTTYDLVVRGPHLAFFSRPSIVSATVSKTQRYGYELDLTKVDESASEALQELQRSMLPETLRAFDYKQPPYDPNCDITQHVMTTNGLQMMPAERARQLLTPPAGVQPREPKLPCEGFWCDPPPGF
jgi:hypothetical protein